MQYGLYMSAAGLQVQEYRQGIQANNLANAQTTGFKRDLAIAQTRLNPAYEQSTLADYRNTIRGHDGNGVWAAPTAIDLTQGPMEQTHNASDMALDGPGFFTVGGANASERFLTRDGRFLVNDSGLLVTATGGAPVLDAQGQKIKLNPANKFMVTTKGEIQQNGTTVGQLGLVNVASSYDVEKIGGNLLTLKPDAKTTPMAGNTQVRQNTLELSDVDPTVEMVQMLEGQRVFEANTKMIQYQDQMMSELNGVGRIA